MQLKYRFNFLGGILLLVCLLISSCKRNTTSTNDTDSAYVSKEFKEFYDKFGSDSIFQMEHIVFPLEGARAMTDPGDSLDVEVLWQPDEWVIQKTFNDLNGQFSQEFFDLSGIVIERIADTSGKFTMERRFGKLSSGWHLIYYKEMGMH